MSKQKHEFGDLMRSLLRSSDMKAYELAEKVGVAPTTISKFLNGAIRPKAETFAKICDELCNTEAVKRQLIGSYTGTDLSGTNEAEEAGDNTSLTSAQERLLAHANEIAFKNKIEAQLKQLSIDYTRNHLTKTCCADFLIKDGAELTALECRYGRTHDLQAEADDTLEIRKQLDCINAFIVIPDEVGIRSADMKNGITIVAESYLASYALGMTQ